MKSEQASKVTGNRGRPVLVGGRTSNVVTSTAGQAGGVIVPRMTARKRTELESFWRAHLDGWRRSDLNQREYCEQHGLPLKRFGNWPTRF